MRLALRGILVGASLLASFSVWSGPSLEEALERERGPDMGPKLTVEFTGSKGRPRAQAWLVASHLGGLSGARVSWIALDSPTARVRLGLGRRDGPVRSLTLDGTDLAWRWEASEVYASVQRRHWGPAHLGSLILDGSAEPLAAIGWRRPTAIASASPWLAWLGPWSGDFFIGGLQRHSQPERPFLIGIRVEAQPFEPLRIGASRTMQWGGRGRPENLVSFLRALVGTDNVGYDGISVDNEPGNQLAGFDWRLTLAPDHEAAWYGQIVGEDEAGKLPSRNFALSGFDARWRLEHGGFLRIFLEWTNTLAGSFVNDPRPGVTYRHPRYAQGYTHDGVLLGHPIGGDAELTSAGFLFERGPLATTLVAGRGRAMPTAQRFMPGRLEIVNAAARLRVGGHGHLGAGAWWTRSAAGRDRAAQIWWQYGWP